MKRSVPYKQEKSVPYHGAVPVAIGVRKIIGETPVGSKRLMSAGLMVELLQEEGLPTAMANRLFSQVGVHAHGYTHTTPRSSLARFLFACAASGNPLHARFQSV